MNNVPFTSNSAGGSCQAPDNGGGSSCSAGTFAPIPPAGPMTVYYPGSASGSDSVCPQYAIDENFPNSVPVDQM